MELHLRKNNGFLMNCTKDFFLEPRMESAPRNDSETHSRTF